LSSDLAEYIWLQVACGTHKRDEFKYVHTCITLKFHKDRARDLPVWGGCKSPILTVMGILHRYMDQGLKVKVSQVPWSMHSC